MKFYQTGDEGVSLLVFLRFGLKSRPPNQKCTLGMETKTEERFSFSGARNRGPSGQRRWEKKSLGFLPFFCVLSLSETGGQTSLGLVLPEPLNQ